MEVCDGLQRVYVQGGGLAGGCIRLQQIVKIAGANAGLQEVEGALLLMQPLQIEIAGWPALWRRGEVYQARDHALQVDVLAPATLSPSLRVGGPSIAGEPSIVRSHIRADIRIEGGDFLEPCLDCWIGSRRGGSATANGEQGEANEREASHTVLQDESATAAGV